MNILCIEIANKICQYCYQPAAHLTVTNSYRVHSTLSNKNAKIHHKKKHTLKAWFSFLSPCMDVVVLNYNGNIITLLLLPYFWHILTIGHEMLLISVTLVCRKYQKSASRPIVTFPILKVTIKNQRNHIHIICLRAQYGHLTLSTPITIYNRPKWLIHNNNHWSTNHTSHKVQFTHDVTACEWLPGTHILCNV